MKPSTIALFFILLIAAATSSQCRKFRGGGISGGTGRSGGGKNKKKGALNWFHNVTNDLGDFVHFHDTTPEALDPLKTNRDSYLDIENDCTDCESHVSVHCTSNDTRDYGEDWLATDDSIRYDFVLNREAQNLVVTCYADFGAQAWGRMKGFFAAIIGERCFDCNWRLLNGGKVELKAEDGFVKSYELSGDYKAAGICQGEKCR